MADQLDNDGICVRDRLLNAAEKVVTRDGVSNLTLEAVAKEAGMSKGGLLYHFSSKSKLIIAIVDRLACRCDADHAREISGDTVAPGAFSRAYIQARTKPMDPCEEPIHSALLAAAATDREYLKPISDRIVAWQQRLENDGIDPITATIIRLAIDGMGLSKLLGLPLPDEELSRRVVGRLLEMSQMKEAAAETGKE
ncbi:MAG TPA: TetR/AcrR family transcriptional regulator [Tepidisphaeraceae bacterium]